MTITSTVTSKTSTDDSAARLETESDGRLEAKVWPRELVPAELVERMYRLYAESYADTVEARFQTDLADKSHVLLLRDDSGRLCGFSTLKIYTSEASGSAVRVAYSGDTIIDPPHWGNSALAFEWLRFAGEAARARPSLPLYWLLIVKGHRTYRYLSTFARGYVPHHRQPATDEDLELLRTLAAERFGEGFDPETGIVHFGADAGRLSDELADIPERHRRLPAVRYFLERNPGYRNGDELVCLCRLAEDNLKPFARRIFGTTSVD